MGTRTAYFERVKREALERVPTEREGAMSEMREQGFTYKAIGARFGLSRSRAHQILARHRRREDRCRS